MTRSPWPRSRSHAQQQQQEELQRQQRQQRLVGAPLLGRHAACAKLILFGEHFVVHGEPALALPLPFLATEIEVRSDALGRPARLAGRASAHSRRLLAAALERLGLGRSPVSWCLTVKSAIPVGQGLGSSAAFAAALSGALLAAAGRTATDEEIRAHADALERLTHGNPSGIDAAVASSGLPVWLVRGAAPELLAAIPLPRLVLASSGESRSTARAIKAVEAARRADPARFAALCADAGALARQGRAALDVGDAALLGELMSRNHELLRALGVSTARLDELVAAARRAGALGAKLTGAGQGGFVVALCSAGDERLVAEAFRGAGAPVVMTTPDQGSSQSD